MTHDDCTRRRFLGTVTAAAAATGRGHIGRVANAAEPAVDRWQPRWILASVAAITAEVNRARACLERTIG